MTNAPRRTPHLAAIRIGPFVFDRTRAEEKACAAYVLEARQGLRTARMLRLILLGYATHRATHSRNPPDAHQG